MKDMLVILVMFAAAIFALPLLGNFYGAAAEDGAEPASVHFPKTLRLYMTERGETEEITAAEYIEGCLAAQIQINCRPEALKAQAAASATYALRLMDELKGSDKLPEGADISDDSRLCQPYMSETERADTYGTDYEKYRDNLQSAAQYGISHIITYGGKPIYAVYHAVSAGGTCPSEYVWGQSLPYLRRADSPADKNSLNFECVNELKSEEIRVALAKYDKSIEIPVDPSKWFTDLIADENGYVISVNIGKNTFSGGDLWRILGLRSTAFTVSHTDGIFTFTTRGHGHGAGLSQYGADSLAAEGWTADKILHHYYGDSVSF